MIPLIQDYLFTSLKTARRKIMEEFLHSTSAHGLSKLSIKNKWLRSLWVITCLTVYLSTFVIIGLLTKEYHDPENIVIRIRRANMTTSANEEMTEYFPRLLVCMNSNTQPSEWEKFFNLQFRHQDGNLVNLSFSPLLYSFSGLASFRICSEIDWSVSGYDKMALLYWNGITSGVDLHIKFGKHMKSPLKDGQFINHTMQEVAIATKDATQTISLPGPRYMDKYPPEFEKSRYFEAYHQGYCLEVCIDMKPEKMFPVVNISFINSSKTSRVTLG
jgi:hypothetical protein